MNTHKKTQDTLFYLIGFCAIGYYCAVIYQNAYNIPKWDDFPEILQFLDRWIAAESLGSKFLAFISQTNEHILLINHGIVLLQYYAIGHLNFAWLIYIGNIFYIGSALTLWLFFKDHSERAFCFAIVMLCGVSFYAYDSTLWAMTAISNQAVIFFSLLAIYAALQHNKNIFFTMLLSTLAVFSQSNGLITCLVIGSYYVSTKEWIKLKQWVIFTITIIGLYAYWFNPASQHELNLTSVFQKLTLSNYALTAPTFVAYFGGTVFTKLTIASLLISFIIGLGILTVAIFQIKRKLFSKTALLVISFLTLSILSIAIYRGLFTGPQVIITSRYKMYGTYFLIVGVLLSPYSLLQLQKSIAWKLVVLSASILYFIWSFSANSAQAKRIDNDLFESLQKWVEDGDFKRGRGYFIKDSDSYLFSALKNKTYNPMVLLPEEMIIKDVKTLNSCPNQYNQTISITADFSILHKNPNAAGIKLVSGFDSNTPVVVTLCSADHVYEFDIPSTVNADNESTYYVGRSAIASGTYDVWIQKNEKYYRLENNFINKPATR